jgi:hypothetical protein
MLGHDEPHYETDYKFLMNEKLWCHAKSLDALFEMKKILWEQTEHWDVLLAERAAISGKLVLSDFTKKALEAFKNKGK